MIYISYLLSLTNFLLNIIAVYKNKKELITYTRDITDIIICSNKIILFTYYVYYNIDFTLPLSQLLLTQNANINISNALTYNIIDYYSTSIIYLYEGNYEYLYHHIITIFCIIVNN